MKQQFFICEHCGNIVAYVKNSGVPVMCCGQKMKEIIPGSVDAAVEKHVPVFTVDANKVYVFVGEVEHPMVEEHYIEWISIQTKAGNQRKCLKAGDKPAVCFSICENDEVEAVYAYCNLHGLWMAENEINTQCEIEPVPAETNENYTVCNCNNVTYFDIIDAAHQNGNIDSLLKVFDSVKNTTKCSTGCGGCYNKVVGVISDVMSGKIQ